MNCVGCATECQTCTGGTNDDCTACNTGFYPQPGAASSCRSTCPEQYYIHGAVCTPCYGACQTCTGNAANACTSCVDSNAETVNPGRCTCKADYIDHDTNDLTLCEPCATECDECTNTTNDDCVACAVGYYPQPGAASSCRSTCPNDYFIDKLCTEWTSNGYFIE